MDFENVLNAIERIESGAVLNEQRDARTWTAFAAIDIVNNLSMLVSAVIMARGSKHVNIDVLGVIIESPFDTLVKQEMHWISGVMMTEAPNKSRKNAMKTTMTELLHEVYMK